MSRPGVHAHPAGARVLMLGNEAIARGALEGGVRLAAAYPGTPSTEIVQALADAAPSCGLYVEWSTNEKVAFEVALAASLVDRPALVAMKHVGLNVAHDPFVVAAYAGARAPLVAVVADDPAAHSSQCEQDSRYVAEQAYWPVLEPSSVAEAHHMAAAAFAFSAEFEHPFLLRSVTRLSHGRGDLQVRALPPCTDETGARRRDARFVPDPGRLVYTPVEARRNRPLMLARFEAIRQAVDGWEYNRLDQRAGARLGIVACGLSHAYVREALRWLGLLEQVSLLKIGTPHPLPAGQVATLLASVERVLVVEELEPFVETHVKAIAAEKRLALPIHGKDLLPISGELSTRRVVEALAELTGKPLPADFAAMDEQLHQALERVPERPPTLCPGCPHRASQRAIHLAAKRVARRLGKDVRPIFPGDIGCYTLSYRPPLEALDTTFCMGASFGMGSGFAQLTDAPVVAQLGDSTFFHSGIPALVNAVFNRADLTMVVLDNAATAMTGFQPHPGTGRTAMGDETVSIRPEDVARACQVGFVAVVDPLDQKRAIDTFEKAISFAGPSLVVARRTCGRIQLRADRARGVLPRPRRIDPSLCDECRVCVDVLGCPALVAEGQQVVIDEALCLGCGLCAQVCPHDAILEGRDPP